MTPNALKMIALMFKENEHFCISNSKYGYMSLPIKIVAGKIPLISNNPSIAIEYVDSSDIIFVALNPMKEKAFRRDSECTKFRNFLIELDTYEKQLQIDYIKNSEMPYSAMIWSGNRSTHTLISLNEDLPDEKSYRFIYKWILNIVALADQALGNPSRSIRICGAIRPETGQEQELIEFKGPVTIKELTEWLHKHPQSKPKERQKVKYEGQPDIKTLPGWMQKTLTEARNGFPNGLGRNSNWFMLAIEMAKRHFPEEQTIEIFGKYFDEEHDFKEKELLSAISSAYKYVENNK